MLLAAQDCCLRSSKRSGPVFDFDEKMDVVELSLKTLCAMPMTLLNVSSHVAHTR